MEELVFTRSLEPSNIVRLIFADNGDAPDEGRIRILTAGRQAGTGLFYTHMTD
jgi:hypothetical protein